MYSIFLRTVKSISCTYNHHCFPLISCLLQLKWIWMAYPCGWIQCNSKSIYITPLLKAIRLSSLVLIYCYATGLVLACTVSIGFLSLNLEAKHRPFGKKNDLKLLCSGSYWRYHCQILLSKLCLMRKNQMIFQRDGNPMITFYQHLLCLIIT